MLPNYGILDDNKQLVKYLLFQDVSDQVESSNIPGTEHPIEYGARKVIRGDWRAHVCSVVAGDLRTRRTYRGERMAHLLRAIRNKVTY